MLPTRVFRESPFKALKILGIILGGVFLFFGFVVLSKDAPQMTSAGLNDSAFLMIVLTAVFGGTMLITFLALSFQSRKVIKCDFEGCEVHEAHFWQTDGYRKGFKWSDVRDTHIVEREHGLADGGSVSIYSFVAETPEESINLLDLKTSSRKNIAGLINYVNEATPHTKYVWIKDANYENPEAVESVYGFNKIARG